MDIPYLIQTLQNKIAILNNAKGQAYGAGDLDRINSIDQDLLNTQTTLSQLQLLLAATMAATATNSDLGTLVAAGVQAAQDAAAIPTDATAVLSGYDISTYASDPLYIQKITDILASMPAMNTTSDIDTYIADEVIGSPLTGQMIMSATSLYDVDIRLTMAIMELDSQFGTAGVGASTFNPGNVGNTGTATQTFSSWDAGVAAVADWLSIHRSAPVIPLPDPTDATTTPPTAATSTPETSPTPTPSPITTDPTTGTGTTTSPTATGTTTDPVLTPIPPTTTGTSTDPVSGTSTDPVTSTSTTPIITNPITVGTTTDPVLTPIPPTTTGTSTGSGTTGTTTPAAGTSTVSVLDLRNSSRGLQNRGRFGNGNAV